MTNQVNICPNAAIVSRWRGQIISDLVFPQFGERIKRKKGTDLFLDHHAADKLSQNKMLPIYPEPREPSRQRTLDKLYRII